MADNTPLLDRLALEQSSDTYSPPSDVTLPNLPFKGFDTSLFPNEGGQPTPSALSALENKLFSISNNGDGKILGGSISRSLKEVSSDRYDNYVPGEYNNEDAYALGQGWPSKMMNAVGKGISLTGTTFLQSTAGMVNGVAQAIGDGRAASFYDNDFNRALDEFNKKLENALPNYYTDGEKNAHWYSPSKLLTANFFWDGIIKNMGFAAGAYLSGGVYASGLKSLSALPAMSKLFSVGKAAETLAVTEEALLAADKAAETYGKVQSLSNRFLNTYNTLNKGQRVLVAGLATTGEAGFEAYYNLNDFRDRKIQEYKDTHDGFGPIGADLETINSLSDDVGNSSFLLNVGLLTATNYIQFPKILGSSDKVERGLIASTTTKEIGNITKDATGKYVEEEAKTLSGKLLKGINDIRPYTFSTSEGFEEGAQYAISQGTNDYYNKKYNNKSTDWLESVIEGINKTIHTDEGMENVLIGGLSGALMLGRSKYKEAAQIRGNTAEAIAKFNNFQLSDFTKATIDSVNRGTILQEEREKSLRQGDILEAKDREQDYIINYLSPRIKYGRYDLVQSDINEYRQLASTDEGFSQLQADGKVLQGDTKSAYLQRLSNLEDVARNIKSLYESLNIRYGNLVDKDKNKVYSPEVLDKMVYAATKVADYDKRIPTLSNALALRGIITDDVINDVTKGKADKYNEAFEQIQSLDILDDKKEDLLRDLNDVSELALRRQLFLKEYNDIKKHPKEYKSSFEDLVNPIAKVEQSIVKEGQEKKTTIEKELEIGKKYALEGFIRREGNEIQFSPKIGILSRTVGGQYETVLPSGKIGFLTPEQFKDYQISEEANDSEELYSLLNKAVDNTLTKEPYKDLKKPIHNKIQYINSLDNKELVDDVLKEFDILSKEFFEQKKQEEKLLKNKQLQKEILGSADPGVQTVKSDSNYEPSFKKSNIAVVTSTKTAGKSILPHHLRANTFGANLDKFQNRRNIKGVLITSKNEDTIGLSGLTSFLKGTSDADASKIIALVMVEDGKPVGVDGKILENPSFDNIIVQVMPDPKLEWSQEFGGGSMFRKDTTPEQIEYYKKQYTEWVNQTLENPSINTYDITASFGIPEYVTYLDERGDQKRDYNARTSVKDAGLITNEELSERPLVFIPATDTTIENNGVVFSTPLGRPFLNLPNAYVKLENRRLTKNEASAVYDAIYALSNDILENQDAKSEKATRLIKWLKSIIYWGTPKNAAGFNSVWFSTINGQFSLSISGKDKTYPFNPSSIEANKEELLALFEGMYNNINSGLTDKPDLWNATYEEILSISKEGNIESKQWPNYQTYLLSPEGRKSEELPLSVPYKPVSDNETNRNGIYFTITNDADRYANPPVKPIVAPKEAPENIFILDSNTINTFVSPKGKKIKFISGITPDSVRILKGGDLEEILKIQVSLSGDEQKAKEAITDIVRKAIIAQSPNPSSTEEFATETVEEEKPKKSIFGKENKTVTPINKIKVEGPVSEMEEFNLDDLDLDTEIPLRVKLDESIKAFKPENWEETQKWLKANFPNIPVYRVKNIIEATNGIQAWGMLKDGAIYVSENAEVGTIYHEVFEAVWKMFSSDEEQSDVLEEFRNRKGTFIDRPSGQTVEYSKASYQQIKEQLAEEFRDYVLYKKIPQKPKDGRPFIVKLFSDLVNFIKEFFTGNKALNNTEKLFDKIGRGYYKQFLPQEQSLSFAKKGFIDIEQAYADSYSEFRIKNIPANVVNDIMQHMTYLTLTDLIRDNKSLFSIPKINKEELYNRLYQKFTKIAEKSGEWEELKKKHQEYLKTFSIEFDENDNTILLDEDASKKGDYQDATKIDVFKKANSAIKLLLSTIPMVDENGKLVRSSIGGVRLLPTSQVFMALMNNIHNSRNIDDMLARVKKMAEEDNNYTTLYNRLSKNTSSLSEISEVHDAQLLTAFWRTFKKQSPDVKNVYIFENGDVEVGDSNLSSAARQISNEYSNAIIKTVKSKNPYFEYSNKEKAFIGKPASVRAVKLDGNQARIAFLKSLGIEFKLNEINKLSSDKAESFKEAVAGIRKSIEKAEKIATVSRKVLDIKGRLMQLSLIRASIDNPEFDSTFFNVKGERTQTFIGTNPVSDLFDVLSQIKNKKELTNTPYEYLLTDVFSQGSVILNKIFNPATGNRIFGSENLMRAGYADGTVNQENGKKKQSAKQTYKERLIQEINLNLKGYYYNLVPGDATTEWMVYMGNHISPSALLSGYSQLHSIFNDYFRSELELSRDNRPVNKKRNNKDLRFLKSILGDDLHNKIIKEKDAPEIVYTKYASQINESVESFVNEESKKLENLLSKYDIIKKTEEGIKVEDLSFSEGETITEGVLKRNLDALSINFIINNIELHKLLYSDPYQYSDELKRIKNANSPRQAIINNSPEFNSALNKIWNKGYSKDDKIGYTDMTKDYFTTATLNDVISTSDLKDYGNFEETDGGGIISLKAYRWFRIKAGEWNDDEEKQYKYDVAYEKDIKNIPLSKVEKKILEDGNPEVKSAYTPIKPIVFGNKLTDRSYNDIVVDKFALYPLSFRIAHLLNPDSNAVKFYNKLQKENIDYAVFATGRKVGNEGVNSLYNDDGGFNDNTYEALVNIPHNIISIQSEVPSKDEPLVTRGSQITKLATLDFMEAGVPIDFNSTSKFEDRYKEWYELTEDEKLKKSSLYKEIKENQRLLESIIDNGYSSLLKRMGIIEDSDGNFIVENIDKIASTLEDEILKREVNDNIIDAFQGYRNGDVVLEATPAYQQIRNILYSIADKNVISPKISGGQKVQIPSTLLESVRAKKERGAYTSDILSFYEDKDGKRVCEIMVGRWFKSNKSDKDLIDYLNNTKGGQDILSGIAYRIPTQKQNSIDSFVIKQFLPREFGDSVVIPSALVKKVGSDFDIDKLFIYFKNIYTDLKGNPQLIPFVGYGQQAKDKLAKMYEEGAFLNKKQREIINKWIENRKEEEKNDTAVALSIAIFGEESYTQEVIDDYLDSISTKDLQNKIIDNIYKKSLENGYIQSLQNLVSHPLNFENLVKPNSAEQLKALAKEITKKLGVQEFSYDDPKNMLSREFMSRLRQAFVSGKYAIGIAAVNQTNHSLNQRQPIYVDNERWDLLTKEDQEWLSGGTFNKEDVVIKFKNYNKLQLENREVPTLSMIKNSKGENISDIIGQFIDGYVDISKGPWIMELGAAPNVASTWLFLVKIGVPIDQVAYFMNQPIIKDYLNSIENAGYSWLFIDSFVDEMKEKYKTSPSELSKIKEIPSNLGDMVGKEKLSPKEKAEQQFILNEFLKYAKMANHMFLVTQGANWDTANFNDSSLVFKKNEQYIKAQSTIISSVNKLVDGSFVGKLSDRIKDVKEAFSTILTSDQPNISRVIENTLRPYIDLNDRDFVKLAQKVKNDLFDWAVQNDRKLNTQIQNILLSDDNTAKEMSDFVVEVRKDVNHPLYNNQIIKLLTPHFSEKVGGVNNLKIKNKDNKVYDQNQMIYAFSELKQYLKATDSELYGSLVRLAVLQSGLTNSPISFTSLIPYEDFKIIYNKTLSTLENYANLADFNKLNVFERNNWNNDDIVPQRRAKMSSGGKYNTNMKFYQPRVSKAIVNKEIPQLVKISNKAGISDSDIIVYTWNVGTYKEQQAKKKIGDYSYIKKGLFKKIYNGNEPFELSYPIKNDEGENVILTDYVYKAINAWGHSHSSEGVYFSANEFYDVAKPSIIDNGFIKVENELSDESILPYFEKQVREKPKEEDSSNEIIPKCI